MSKWKIVTISTIVVLVVGAAVVIGRMVFATKDRSGNSDTPAVETATVARDNIDVKIDATGTIKPLNIVEISSKASGKILELRVDAGDYVEKDDIIAVIEKTYVEISLEQAEDGLKLSLTNQKQIDRKHRDLESAKASLKRSQGQRDLRQIEFEDTIIKTDEQRERFREMRQQRQAEGANQNRPNRPNPQETTTQTPIEPDIAKVEEQEEAGEDDWGSLFGGFMAETTAEDVSDTPQQAATQEADRTPFSQTGYECKC